MHLRQACQPLQLPLGIRIHHSHDITRQPSGGQSCRLCGAVVRRNTKRLQVPCRKLAVANRHGQVLGGKKKRTSVPNMFLVSTPWDHDSGLFWYPPVIPSPWSMANVIGRCGRLLLHGRANQSCVNRHGATPLLLAAEAGHREVISTLLQGRDAEEL